RESRRRRLAQDAYGLIFFDGRAVAQLAPAIVTPTVRDAADGDTAAMPSPERAHVRETERPRYQCGKWTPDVGCVPELTLAVCAPAVAVASRRPAAAVERPCGDLRERHAGRDRERHSAAGDRRPQSRARFRGHGAELAAVVVAPAVRRSTRREGTALVPARTQGREAVAASDGERSRAALGALATAQLRGGAACAEFAIQIQSPAVRRAARDEPAGVDRAHADG